MKTPTRQSGYHGAKRVVVIGGGTGTFTILQALRDLSFDLTAIVSTADDGGSTGILRDELGVLPPGDLRQALVALSTDQTVLRDLLNYRFTEGSLKGHSFGNLLISALEKITGSFDRAILEAGRVLAVKGSVLPVTTDHMHLRAETVQGKIIQGEHTIEEHLWAEGEPLTRFWVEPRCVLHPLARQAIERADLIIVAPGSVYTSLIPNFLVDGMGEALHQTRAKVAYVVNLMTERGQASEFFVQDFVDLISSYLGGVPIDYVVYNTKLPSSDLLARYQRERERTPVRLDRKRLRNLPYRLIGANLVDRQVRMRPGQEDALANSRTLIRHDTKRLARVLSALVYLQEAERYLSHHA